MQKPELDTLINKFISRKLIVFIIACIGFQRSFSVVFVVVYDNDEFV